MFVSEYIALQLQITRNIMDFPKECWLFWVVLNRLIQAVLTNESIK